jgi:DNA-directed RNA polymerase specialized sigma24 family protein
MTPHAKDVDDRLAANWALRKFDEAFIIMRDELALIVCDDLIRRTDVDVSYEDAQDIVQEAFQGLRANFQKRGPDHIKQPRAYLWQSAINRARRFSERKAQFKQVEFDDGAKYETDENVEQLEDMHQSGGYKTAEFTKEDRARFIYEGIFDSEEISPEPAARVVAAALPLLDDESRAVIESIIAYGPDQTAALGGQRLGIGADHYRVRKFRAYKRLKKIIPKVAKELGVGVLRFDAEAEIEPEVYVFEDSEDENSHDDR